MQTSDRIRYSTDCIPLRLSAVEYWELISAEMNVLYGLSFLLTANKERADHCLEQTLDEYIEGADDFLEWARTSGRETVLKYAILTIKPDPDATMDFSDKSFLSAGDHLFRAIAALPAFPRFVFGITTIYGKSETECARLLGATRWEVKIVRDLTEQILLTNCGEGRHNGRMDLLVPTVHISSTHPCYSC